MSIRLKINQQEFEVDDKLGGMPLLWFLREEAGLKGSKFGCGIGQCGACTVHIEQSAVRSCAVTLNQIDQRQITTIEGLATNHEDLHPVQQAWIEEDVPQCGYCQAGQIMAAAAMLLQSPNPTDEEIDRQMTNICRCGTYVRIRRAVKIAAMRLAEKTA